MVKKSKQTDNLFVYSYSGLRNQEKPKSVYTDKEIEFIKKIKIKYSDSKEN